MKDILDDIDRVLDHQYAVLDIPRTVTEVIEHLFPEAPVGQERFRVTKMHTPNCARACAWNEESKIGVNGLDGSWYNHPAKHARRSYAVVRSIPQLLDLESDLHIAGIEARYCRYLAQCIADFRKALDWPAFAYIVEELGEDL